jgi:2,3-bisphosphoglycerate-dependent phosphoglycerate mutase
VQQRWPERLWIVRHGQSAGNVAKDAAYSARSARIEIEARDVDVPLSELGKEQSKAVAKWFASMAETEKPQVLLTSPYVRARQTGEAIRAAGGLAAETSDFVVDERLREKELGALDRLTWVGIEQLFPDEAAYRARLGKFYYRPPAGESWCDVILRLRSALDTISLHYGGKRVLIIAHQVVVLCLRYLLENLDEQKILTIDAEGEVANCSVTEYAFQAEQDLSGKLILHRYNFLAPLAREGAPVTSAPDAKVGPR